MSQSQGAVFATPHGLVQIITADDVSADILRLYHFGKQRPATPEEVAELRCSWWRMRGKDWAPPPERGIIVIDGGRE